MKYEPTRDLVLNGATFEKGKAYNIPQRVVDKWLELKFIKEYKAPEKKAEVPKERSKYNK